jgi:two-component system, OmpR family, alkaline phosphatase synthesis response regulator PhoP
MLNGSVLKWSFMCSSRLVGDGKPPMPARYNILIVEDDPEVAGALQELLEHEGYAAARADSGDVALTLIRQRPPDLLLLDRMLPGLSGDEIVRRVRADSRTKLLPIILLTGKAEESDQLVGLALGADDYVSKPFSPRLLMARVAAQLRRRQSASEPDESTAVSSVALDRNQPQVFVNHVPVSLTSTEYRILASLIAARGHVLARAQLLAMVYGKERPAERGGLDGPLEGLRRKMGAAARCIQEISGAGYAYCDPGNRPPPA